MFNPWKHVRNAACVMLFVSTILHNFPLMWIGMVTLMSGIVGGLDLSERRIELLEKKEKSDEKTETPESN